MWRELRLLGASQAALLLRGVKQLHPALLVVALVKFRLLCSR